MVSKTSSASRPGWRVPREVQAQCGPEAEPRCHGHPRQSRARAQLDTVGGLGGEEHCLLEVHRQRSRRDGGERVLLLSAGVHNSNGELKSQPMRLPDMTAADIGPRTEVQRLPRLGEASCQACRRTGRLMAWTSPCAAAQTSRAQRKIGATAYLQVGSALTRRKAVRDLPPAEGVIQLAASRWSLRSSWGATP